MGIILERQSQTQVLNDAFLQWCSSRVEFLERSLVSLTLCPLGPTHCPAWSRGSGHFFLKLNAILLLHSLGGETTVQKV